MRGANCSTIPRKDIRYTFETIAAPVFTSTITLGVGFVIMAKGQFQFGATMGLLTAICIGLSMITVFTLLPCMLLHGNTDQTLVSRQARSAANSNQCRVVALVLVQRRCWWCNFISYQPGCIRIASREFSINLRGN